MTQPTFGLGKWPAPRKRRKALRMKMCEWCGQVMDYGWTFTNHRRDCVKRPKEKRD